MRDNGIETSEILLPRQRRHSRFLVKAKVALVREGIAQPVMVRSLNVSWGGACLLVPGRGLDVDEATVLRFPWGRRDSFSTHAQVVWNQQIDDEQCLVGVVFTRLRVCDEEKLKRLLSMLVHSHDASEQDITIADELEICYLDHAEMLATLEHIRFGCLVITLFQPFKVNERVGLVLRGLGDMPKLHLRARILWQKDFGSTGSAANPQTSGMFQTELALDHPYDDLKRVTAPLIARLQAHHDGVLPAVA